MSAKKGFTVFEVLTAVTITFVITGISVSVFSRLANSTNLDRDANIVLSYISKSRTMAIDSVGGVQHGVKLMSKKVSIFSGTSFVTTNTESSYSLLSSAVITQNLSNSTTTIYFSKLTGNPSATGTITLTAKGETKVIVIYATGLAEIQ